MNDLKRRLEKLDRLEMPEQWVSIERRAPRLDLGPERISRRHAAGVIVLALLLTTAASVLLVISFRASPPAPAPLDTATSTPSQEPAAKGVRVTLHPLVEGAEQMPTGVMTLGDQAETVCTEDFEWILSDGSRIRGISDPDRKDAIPPCKPLASVLRVPAGTPISVLADEATYVRATRSVAPLYAGLETVAIEARWVSGEATFLAFLDVVVTESSPTEVELTCPRDDQISFEAPHRGRLLPGGSDYIRANLAGVKLDDIVEQMTLASPRTTESDGTWQVVRDGAVIASVEWPSLEGVACRGSGIGGVEVVGHRSGRSLPSATARPGGERRT